MDEPTIQAARRGDRSALGDLLRALQGPWYRFSLSLLGDVELAREAVQETGLRFLRQVAGFRGESQLQTWSLGIALNVCRELRRRGRRPSRGLPDGIEDARPRPGPRRAAELSEQGRLLRTALADLPQRQREAVVLRFFEGLSVEQTAAAMECAEGTVKATVHQALRAMRAKLPQSLRLEA